MFAETVIIKTAETVSGNIVALPVDLVDPL
jgi:hypothetical protein